MSRTTREPAGPTHAASMRQACPAQADRYYPVLALQRYINHHPYRRVVKHVGLTLATHLGGAGRGWCAVKTLQREVGSVARPASNSTISRALRDLCRSTPEIPACLIQTIRGLNRPAIYEVSPAVALWWREQRASKAKPPMEPTLATSPLRASCAAVPPPAGLQRFLSAYPIHRAQGEHRSKVLAAWLERGSPDGDELEELLNDLEQWKLSRRWRGQGGLWVPSPARFLAHERYRSGPLRDVLPGHGVDQGRGDTCPLPTPESAQRSREAAKLLVEGLAAHLAQGPAQRRPQS